MPDRSSFWILWSFCIGEFIFFRVLICRIVYKIQMKLVKVECQISETFHIVSLSSLF